MRPPRQILQVPVSWRPQVLAGMVYSRYFLQAAEVWFMRIESRKFKAAPDHSPVDGTGPCRRVALKELVE